MANQATQEEDWKIEPVKPRFLVCIDCNLIHKCRRIDWFVWEDYEIIDDKVIWTQRRTRVNQLILSSIMKNGFCPAHSSYRPLKKYRKRRYLRPR